MELSTYSEICKFVIIDLLKERNQLLIMKKLMK